ncbi:MAG: MarR family transcriptional regulator [Bryobacteraceae bacterium]|nr:MarR family transcriptional regulator [Bryobacteraceae bacterium]
MPELPQQAFVALLRAAEAVTQSAAALLKQHSLTPAQYNVLRILRGAGPQGHLCREVGERLIQREPDVTRLLDRLEKRGFTTRARSDTDRRALRITITPAGLQLLATLDQPVRDLHRAQFSALSERRLLDLIRTLNLLTPGDHL